MSLSDKSTYWYLASYPKSGNTWCRVFITELRRLAGLDGTEATAAASRRRRARELGLTRTRSRTRQRWLYRVHVGMRDVARSLF